MYVCIQWHCSNIIATGKDNALVFAAFCCYIALMTGRHKKPESEAKTYMLRIRMTEAERALLEEAAKVKSLETSTWVRMEAVALAKKIVKQNR